MKLKLALVGTLALSLLGPLSVSQSAAAQSGTKTYEITVKNITTSKQMLSPVAFATHPASVHAWQMGQNASPGLELLAEDGMPDKLASEWVSIATDVATTHAHLLPGDSITVKIRANQGDVLSAATMLVQTNDGFTGLHNMSLSDPAKETMAYDAGTEQNTEAAVDIPGPPFGGKMNGPATTPRGVIAMHEGITGKANVTPDFNWAGPVASFTINEVDLNAVTPGSTMYDVTLKNTTNSMQMLSPMVVASHPASAKAWRVGETSSAGLELLAEDGNPSLLATELSGMSTDVAATAAHLLPGDFITVRISANDGDVLSAATMLVQTNDAFTGLDSVDLTNGVVLDMMAYDAGTEQNTEKGVDIPGPPFGGKLNGPASEPRQPIVMHENIKGTGDVTPEFKWSGPVASFSVTLVAATSMPGGMPTTGSGDATLFWLVTILAATLALTGLTLRRTTATQR